MSAEAQGWSLGDRLILASFIALAFLLGVAEIADTDLWWHLRTGQLMLERGEIPRTDWFTYTNPESPWIDLHWGFQLLITGLWSLGGAPAVILATASVGAATFAMLVRMGKPGWPVWQAAACLLPSLLLFAGRYHPRPEMLTQLLLVATLLVLQHIRARPRLVWWLPLFQLVWVNVHALFILGWIAWGAFLVDAAFRAKAPTSVRPTGDPPETPADWQRWGLVSLAMLACDLANPYGVTGFLFPLTIFTRISSERDFYVQHAGEFQSMGEFLEQYGASALFFSLSPLMLLVIFSLGVTSFALLVRRGRFPVDRLLLFAAFAYLAWQANRNAALFALVGGLVVRLNFGEWRDLRQASRKDRSSPDTSWAKSAVMVVLALLLFSIPLEIFPIFRPIEVRPLRLRTFTLDEVPHWHAHEASKFLGRKGMPQQVYAMHLGQAAVYLFHNGPERRVFADPRLEVNTRETLQRSLDVMDQLLNHDPRAEENLRIGIEPDAEGRRELPALLLDFPTVKRFFPRLVSNPRWRLVYLDEYGPAAVFLSHEKADALGLRAVDLSLLGLPAP